MTFKPPGPPKWATHIRNRSPKFKVHAQRGHALNAIANQGAGFGITGTIYELVDGEWAVFLDVQPPTKCEAAFHTPRDSFYSDRRPSYLRSEVGSKKRLGVIERYQRWAAGGDEAICYECKAKYVEEARNA